MSGLISPHKPSWFSIAMRGTIVIRSIKIALVVGSVLGLLNHGDKILTGALNNSDIYKIIITYLVPYCVSTYSAVQNELTHWIARQQQHI